MKENFIICIQAVLPMFITLTIGYLVRRRGFVNDGDVAKMNSLAFKILFPFLMFDNIYGTTVSETFNVNFTIFALAGIAAVYAASTLFVLKIEKKPKSRGAMIQAMYRSNFVLMGLPVAINIFGHGNVGVTAVMIAIVVPIYNILAVITLEVYRKGKINISKILKRIVTNPLILGAIAGIIFMLFNWHLPRPLEVPIEQLSTAASPIALLILGASFQFSALKKNLRNILICITVRLVVVPGILLTIAFLMGFRDIYFITLVGIFAAPCAVSSYTMAREMHSDHELAAATVVFTSAACCFTMFVWLFLFKNLGAF